MKNIIDEIRKVFFSSVFLSEKLYWKYQAKIPRGSFHYTTSRTEKEQSDGEKNRIALILDAAQKGQWRAKGDLALSGCDSLAPVYYETPSAFVAEKGLLSFDDEAPAENPDLMYKYQLWKNDENGKKKTYLLNVLRDYEWLKKTQKPLIVLNNGLICVLKPNMNVKHIMKAWTDLRVKSEALRLSERWARKKALEEFDASLPALELKNPDLWNEIIAQNRQARHQFSPREFINNPQNRIDRLNRYAGILQSIRQTKGYLMPQDVLYADDKAGLSIDLKRISPALKDMDVRFEALRFWADAILVRTWKYGDDLLKAEGFNSTEIEQIKTDAHLPLVYTYWENMGHPYIRDVRITSFWRDQNKLLARQQELSKQKE